MSGTPGNPQLTPDEALAQAALKRRLLTPEQIREAFSEQAREVAGGRAKVRPTPPLYPRLGPASRGRLSEDASLPLLRSSLPSRPSLRAPYTDYPYPLTQGGEGAVDGFRIGA